MTDTSKAAIAAVVERLGGMMPCRTVGHLPLSGVPEVEFDIAAIDAQRKEAAFLISALEAERDALKQINANLMGDDENVPRYTTRRLKQEIARHMEAAEALNATLISALEAERDDARKLANQYAWERDKAREERDAAEHRSESFWKPLNANIVVRAERAELELGAERSSLARAIGSVRWMDPPDGGDVSLPEQVRRMRTDLEAAEALNATLQEKLEKAAEALEWYGEQARLARLMHSGGDAGRHALQDDGGKRAASTLSTLREAGNDQT